MLSMARQHPMRRGMQILLIHLPIENETLHSGLHNNVVT